MKQQIKIANGTLVLEGNEDYVETVKFVCPTPSVKPDKMSLEEAEKILKSILDEHEIELSFNSCGCCFSPWATLKYKGQLLFKDVDDFGFSNIKDNES